MYMRFFGLNRLPFEASPDPGFLFDSPAHREAIASIEYAVATRMGFIMLTGEVGLGKTTVIRAFLDRYDRDRLLPIYVFHPLLSFDELLVLISDELGLRLSGGIGSFNRLRAIQMELIRLYEAQRQVILIIDEAQRLPEDSLENLRLLTNLETNEAKLLQIVLVGQPELEAVLEQPHLRQLEQRIVLKAKLETLSAEDSLRYLRHRLMLAGADKPEDVMTAAAMKAVVEISRGVPRRLNVLANRALIDAFGANEKPVSAGRVRKVAAAHNKPKPVAASAAWTRRAATLAFLASLAAGAGAAALWPSAVARPALSDLAAMLRLPATHNGGSVGVPNPAALTSTRAPVTAPMPAAPMPAGPAQLASATVPPPAPAPALVSHAAATPEPAAAAPSQLTATSTPAPVPQASPAKPDDASQPAPMPAASPAPTQPAPIHTAPIQTAAMTNGMTPPPGSQMADTPVSQTVPVSLDHWAIDGTGNSWQGDLPYDVAPGDTLWKICLRAYGPDLAPTMITRVMSRNRITAGMKLMWGTTIVLPSPRHG
jgi:general secretion pathway protein A